MKIESDFWFVIEPYVYIGVTECHILLFNTLDNNVIESSDNDVIKLFFNLLDKDNNGVCLLSRKLLSKPNVIHFIEEVRSKYMGDIIDTSYSQIKPVQILPYVNTLSSSKSSIYKRHNFTAENNLYKYLSEINIYIDEKTNIIDLQHFLLLAPDNIVYNILGNMNNIKEKKILLEYLISRSTVVNIQVSYKDIDKSCLDLIYPFLYTIVVDFPVNINTLTESLDILQSLNKPFFFIFNISSLNDCKEAEAIIDKYKIKGYRFNPIYTISNINFLEEYVFSKREDILSNHISIKDIFLNQSINVYDFGKINIKPNGAVYANLKFPAIGDIYDDLHELIENELLNGKSWLRIRNQAPCSNCVFQWLCPSPSSLELSVGRPNLCNVNNV